MIEQEWMDQLPLEVNRGSCVGNKDWSWGNPVSYDVAIELFFEAFLALKPDVANCGNYTCGVMDENHKDCYLYIYIHHMENKNAHRIHEFLFHLSYLQFLIALTYKCSQTHVHLSFAYTHDSNAALCIHNIDYCYSNYTLLRSFPNLNN